MAANGFRWIYNLSGERPLVHSFFFKSTETLTVGDFVNIETGEIDLAISGNTAFAGIFTGPLDPADAKDGEPGKVEGVDSTTLAKVLVNPDAVYECFDENARQPGAPLDIVGSTGAMTVTTSGDNDVVVVERKFQTTDPTRVMITTTIHYLVKAH